MPKVQSSGVIHYGNVGVSDSESDMSTVSSDAPSVHAALTYALPPALSSHAGRSDTARIHPEEEDDANSTRTPIPMSPPSQSAQVLPSSFLRHRTSTNQSSNSSLSDLSEDESSQVKRHKREEMNVGRLVVAAKQQQNFAQMWFQAGIPTNANALPALFRKGKNQPPPNVPVPPKTNSMSKIRFQEPEKSSGPIDLDTGENWEGDDDECNDSKKDMEVGTLFGFQSTTHSTLTRKRSNRRFISFGVPDDEDLTYLTERKGLDRVVCVVGNCRVTLLALLLILVGVCAITAAAVITGLEYTPTGKKTISPTRAPSSIPSSSPTVSPRPSSSPSFSPSVSTRPSVTPTSSPTFFYSSTKFDQVGNDLKLFDNDFKNYGYSVALTNDGQTLAVSAPGPVVLDNADITSLPEEDRKGYVVVYQRGTGASGSGQKARAQWINKGSMLQGRNLDSAFGNRLELSDDGNILAVSERNYVDPVTQINKETVRVYQYDEVALDWIPMGSDLSQPVPNQLFGDGLSLSADGKRIVVGGPNSLIFRQGQATVYEYNDTLEDWDQKGNYLTGLMNFNDQFGYDVSISANGNVVACSGPNGGSDKAGYVKIFEWDDQQEDWITRGNEIVYLSGGGIPIAAKFGSSISISGDGRLLIVGSPSSTVDDLSDSGHASIWQYGNENFNGIVDEEQWFQIGEDLVGTPTRNQKFGLAVSISRDGQYAATSAPNNDFFRGQVLVSRWNGDFWDSAEPLFGASFNENFGKDIVLTEGGDYLAAGAPATSNFFKGGLTRVFEWTR